MNINFHYYCVKALARTAGFGEAESQLIAEYSQFIDDYDTRATVSIRNIKPEAINQGLAKADGDRYQVKLVTTGFNSFIDNARLSWESVQNSLLIPFHFILPQPLAQANYDLPVTPARIKTGSLITTLLDQARHHLAVNRRAALIRIGMLLHIFADTWAHQRFSGHHLKKINNYKLTKVQRHGPNVLYDETVEYQAYAGFIKFASLPAIGHGTIGHAPDVTSVKFTMAHQNDSHNVYSRDNYVDFKEAAREMYDFLKLCGGDLGAPDFRGLEFDLETGFAADHGDGQYRRDGWRITFPDIAFDYSKKRVMQRLFVGALPDSLGAGENAPTEARDQAIEAIMADTISSGPERDLTLAAAVRTEVSEEFWDFTLFAHHIRQSVAGGYLDVNF